MILTDTRTGRGSECHSDYRGERKDIPVRSSVLLKHAYVTIRKGPNIGWKFAKCASVGMTLSFDEWRDSGRTGIIEAAGI